MRFTLDIAGKILEDYNKHYKDIINKVYSIPYEENPEAFIFYDLDTVDVFLVKVDTEYTSGYKGYQYYLLAFQGTGQRETYFLSDEDYAEFYKYGRNTEQFLTDFLHSRYKTGNFISSILENYLYRLELVDYEYDKWYIDIESHFQHNASLLIKRHGETFSKHINQPAMIYADRAYKYTYSDLDFTDIVQVVDDKDFEYALNESLAAYEHNLYLAATSTAGTALENLVITILEKNSIKFDYNQGTELGRLTNLLLNEEIINKKMKQRIMNSASLRNLASHANKGRTIREDAKSIYQIIYTLSSEVYLPQV